VLDRRVGRLTEKCATDTVGAAYVRPSAAIAETLGAAEVKGDTMRGFGFLLLGGVSCLGALGLSGCWSAREVEGDSRASLDSVEQRMADSRHERDDHGCDQRRPDILMILADDLGYSDIGAFGGEIRTPNLDALAAEGQVLTNHHAAALCSPTRAGLISGADPHLVGLGTMAEALSMNPGQVGKPGYEGFLRSDALSVAQLLLDNGYHTYMAGKWHLGTAVGQGPSVRGFEASWGPLGGFESHFAPTPGLLTAIDTATVYADNGVTTVPPVDYFSTNFYTDKLIENIQANLDDGKPLFVYAAYTAPHWPLMAPEDYINRYAGKYDEGYTVIRNRRIERMKQLGVLPADFQVSAPLPVTTNSPGWEELTLEQKQVEARKMEVYAAMVENLDYNIGRLLAYLKSIDRYDNTFIFFQSDNGSEGATTYRPTLTANVDNSLGNIGRARSNVATGRRWAEVSATPFKLSKGYQTEGGIAVPAIVRLPGHNHHGRKRRHFQHFSRVTDLAPTFLELAGVADPGDTYNGQTVFPMSGASMLNALEKQKSKYSVHDRDEFHFGELLGRRFVQRAEWKAVWTESPWGPGQWELFNIDEDRGETTDLAAAHPDIVAEFDAAWTSYVSEVGIETPNVFGWPAREGQP
jgi:arylsulfatase A-like enzyme